MLKTAETIIKDIEEMEDLVKHLLKNNRTRRI